MSAMADEATRSVQSRISVRPIWEHVFVTHPDYIRQKARQMRVEKDLTIDEIAERLGISRQTIYSWVGDLPIKKERAWNPSPGVAEIRTRYRVARDEAYAEGF